MGHWSVLNAMVYLALRRSHKPYVVCPAGALPIFGRSRWLKHIYNFVVGNRIIRNASGWIAVTAAEFPHFENYGIPSSNVTVIPNGVSKEDFPPTDVEVFRRAKNFPNAPIILFMGRLNLIKGPDLLLRAFASIQDLIPDYHLVFAGPDEGMQSALTEMARQEGIVERVHFLGFVSGNGKLAAYQSARLLVVPSRQEAMSIVALEAAISGTPVMLTDQCGFDELKSIESGLVVPASVEGIADGLIHLLTEPGLLDRISPPLQNFVLQRYTWQSIVARYLNLYDNILSSSESK
jgi:glycosyltransferase involved in cell wall biosynthesis